MCWDELNSVNAFVLLEWTYKVLKKEPWCIVTVKIKPLFPTLSKFMPTPENFPQNDSLSEVVSAVWAFVRGAGTLRIQKECAREREIEIERESLSLGSLWDWILGDVSVYNSNLEWNVTCVLRCEVFSQHCTLLRLKGEQKQAEQWFLW